MEVEGFRRRVEMDPFIFLLKGKLKSLHSPFFPTIFVSKHTVNVYPYCLSPQMGNSASIAAFAGGVPPGVSGMNDRCTVIVSNLNPDKIDEDKLFNLFSLYGNILRIKLLRSKPDHALVEMSDGFQAELTVHFLKIH
ncbi:polypyrimidine tract-binding protein homolog 3-like [Silene latifolia]|uniref:polypyrimidine tract-binding protein homolog 3-like n=1 Tax=Silene latifolia TaxID=37657 RepID=UPI003D7769E6